MGANKSEGRIAWCLLRGWGQRVVKNSQKLYRFFTVIEVHSKKITVSRR
jgi:hypothetical protein